VPVLLKRAIYHPRAAWLEWLESSAGVSIAQCFILNVPYTSWV
jgi:hypothetical protein